MYLHPAAVLYFVPAMTNEPEQNESTQDGVAQSQSAQTPADRAKTLIDLARARFGDDLTDAEETLFTATANGIVANYREGDSDDDINDPENAEHWGEDRVLKANRIAWLCTDPSATKEVTDKGVNIWGARIEDEIQLSFARIDFPFMIYRSAIPDGIVLAHAQLYFLNLTGTHTGPIFANGINVEKGIFLRNGFKVNGNVELVKSTIGETLECDNGQFINMNGLALAANGIEVKGSINLRNGFRAEGGVDIHGCTIGGHLDCENGYFSNPNSKALNVNGSNIQRSIFLCDGFKAEGEVDLLASTIGGNIDCDNGQFINPKGYALEAESTNIKGHVMLRDEFQPEGIVDFGFATVSGGFAWRGIIDPKKCVLILENAKIGTLSDEAESWPAKVALDGFVYDRIDKRSPTDSKTRLKWIKLQHNEEYVPQPYEQLAKVLKEMGHEKDAREILIAKQEDPALLKSMSRLPRLWHFILGATIGYGYKPGKALWWIMGFLIVGSFVFNNCAEDKKFIKITSGESSAFNPVTYSIDTFVPLVDLHQAKFRLPSGELYRLYLWIHISAGWLLTTLLIAGITGLVRK